MSVERDIEKAVETALNEGLSPREFIQKAFLLWGAVAIEKREREDKEISEIIVKIRS